MYLSDKDIVAALKRKDITIRGFDRKRLQPASYDVLLDNKFQIVDPHLTSFVDPHHKVFPATREVEVKDLEPFVLHPGISVLGMTRDYVGAKRKYLIQISGKSSLARAGLIVHNTAGLINPGHYLQITLELSNMSNVPIILRPGMEIAQLLFSKLSTPPLKDYSETGRYHGSNWEHWKPAKET